MPFAERFAAISAGAFFLAGLVFGVWKYAALARSSDARAPVYVDVAHRAALLYAFACLVVERFAALSGLGADLETVAVVGQIVFFALGLSTYVIHGLLRDTDNQFEKPHRLGKRTVPPALVVAFMVALIAAELGGFAVLFYGACTAPA